MDEQRDHGKTQVEKESIYNLERGSGPLEGIQEGCEAIRGVTGKDKAHLELNLIREIEDNKKGFFKCVNNRRKPRENAGLLLNVVEQLNNSFASVFSAKTAF